MGRRSTKTTKAGKFMNPTDQFRKEQRKKELKKNKKQRLIVREAVLRMKDVGQMLKEIEEIEEQELRNFGQPQHNEKGLEEKKIKLHASIHRVARFYQEEDPKKAQELKLMVIESEQRRREMSRIYNSYTAARSKYSIEDIPMPDSLEGGLSDIPMPAASGLSEEQSASFRLPLTPPPPPGPPPSDLVEYNVVETPAAKSVRFADQSVEFPEQSVELGEQLEDDPDDSSSSEESDQEEEADDETNDDGDDKIEAEKVDVTKPLLGPARPHPPALPRLPPPAPPGPPPLLAQTFPPRFGIPPGPPPGAPPRFTSLPRPLMAAQIHSQAVVSAPPTRVKSGSSESKPVSAVISAQPQLRNMTAEVTKFMPTSLRVRRNQPKTNKPKLKLGQEPIQQIGGRVVGSGAGVHMQGDAYDTFMQEMQGLL